MLIGQCHLLYVFLLSSRIPRPWRSNVLTHPAGLQTGSLRPHAVLQWRDAIDRLGDQSTTLTVINQILCGQGENQLSFNYLKYPPPGEVALPSHRTERPPPQRSLALTRHNIFYPPNRRYQSRIGDHCCWATEYKMWRADMSNTAAVFCHYHNSWILVRFPLLHFLYKL